MPAVLTKGIEPAPPVMRCMLPDFQTTLLKAGWGKNQGQIALLLTAFRVHKGPGRPVSRILLYPAIHLRGIPGLHFESRTYQSQGRLAKRPYVTIWLARTGGLPGRSLAGYRRWALTPPFHPSPVIGSETTRSIGWSALCCT
jgi:hypothetical protein